MTQKEIREYAIKNLRELKRKYKREDNIEGVATMEIAIMAIKREIKTLPLEFSLYSVDGGKSLWLSREDAVANQKERAEVTP